MIRKLKKMLIFLLAILLATQSIAYASTSKWAATEINSAKERGLLSRMDDKIDMQSDISRRDTASLLVAAYEKLSEKPVEITLPPILDCTDTDVRKAVSLGLMELADNKFLPDNGVNREEMFLYVFRIIKAICPDKAKLPSSFQFVDSNDFSNSESGRSSYGAASYLYSRGILRGVFKDTGYPEDSGIQALPQMRLSYEQAIIFEERLLDAAPEFAMLPWYPDRLDMEYIRNSFHDNYETFVSAKDILLAHKGIYLHLIDGSIVCENGSLTSDEMTPFERIFALFPHARLRSYGDYASFGLESSWFSQSIYYIYKDYEAWSPDGSMEQYEKLSENWYYSYEVHPD